MEKDLKELTEKQSYYLLWVTIMNQSQSSKKVIQNTSELLNRLGSYKVYNQLTHSSILKCMHTYPKLHRFPNKMADYIYASINIINSKFNGNIIQVFSGNKELIIDNLCSFFGINAHKASICFFMLECVRNNKLDEMSYEKLNCNISMETIINELDIINNL